MNTIETQDLCHSFNGTDLVLNNINLMVPKSRIYVFLGQNGAGKSTTLKLILGLLKIQHGSIKIFDQALDHNRISIYKKTGSLIESPSIYENLTAKENLIIHQKIHQCPLGYVDDTLSLVGLSDTKNKLASEFSMGMKQRLAIGIALLHKPSLLILDEPTNGLDPNGMIDIRDLIIHLNNVLGITIVISSHILSEIEKVASHIGIINKGKLAYQDTADNLINAQETKLRLITNDNTNASVALHEQGIIHTCIDDQIHISVASEKDTAMVIRSLVENNVDIYSIDQHKEDLESLFLEIINK